MSLIEVLKLGNYSCVIKNRGRMKTFAQRGIAELYDLYINEKVLLKGATVADKSIGKAAAGLMVLAGVKQVSVQTISTPALSIFRKNGIAVDFENEVPVIINRTQTDWCPMEKLCYYDDSLVSMLSKIRHFVLNLRSKMLGITFVCLFMCFAMNTIEAQDSLSINQKVHTIDEVSVTGVRNETDIRKLPLTISIISEEQIQERYESSLLPVLNEQVPGLFITSRGVMGYGVSGGSAGTMSVRGIGGNPTTGVMVLVDGIPQNMGLMGHPIPDIYQSMLAERVEVVRGPASVLYGSNAMGGVINVVTPKFKNDTILTKVNLSYGSYNTLQTGVLNRYQKGRFSSKFSASYNRSDGHRDNLDFEQYSVYEKLAYQFNDAWTAYADVNRMHYTASNSGAVDALLTDNDADITRSMTALSLQNDYDKTSGAFKLYYNIGEHEINDGYAAGEEPKNYLFKSKDIMAGANIYQSINLFQDNYITLGADYLTLGGQAWKQFETSRFDIADTTEQEFASYIDIRQTLGGLVTFDAGLRYNYHTRSGKQWIPQAGLSFHLPRQLEVKALFSKGFRNPTLKDLYMFGSQNPDLLPEHILNYELSMSQQLLDSRLRYGVNIFYLNGDNMIQTVFKDGRPQNVNTGAVENYGVEGSISYQINESWSTSSNYSWLGMKYPVIAAPEHKVYADVNYTMNKLKLTTGVQYVHGLYTSVTPEMRENYLLWNMRASYHITSFAHVYLRGENLLNQEYEINKGYPMPKATFNIGVSCQF